MENFYILIAVSSAVQLTMHVHSAILFQFETLGQRVVHSSDVSTTFICILHYADVWTFATVHSPGAAAMKIRIKMYALSIRLWLEIAVQYRELVKSFLISEW